jgi:hypothetical protein
MKRSPSRLRMHQFEYGPLARGCYLALACLLPVSAILSPELLAWHVLLVLFLGIGLRPLLEQTGAYALYTRLENVLRERWNHDFTERRRCEIERRARRARYRRFGPEDPRLPKKW